MKLSSSYHPETDGQTERVNGVINQYVRCYCTYLQDNWVELLATCEFAYNNTVHTSTGVTPFMANTGMNPRMGPIGTAHSISGNANLLVEKLDHLETLLCENLEQSQADMKKFADENRRDVPSYKPGDKVFVSAKNISTNRPKQKWNPLRMGPYKIIGEAYPGLSAYVVQLPESLKLLHPVFHTSFVRM